MPVIGFALFLLSFNLFAKMSNLTCSKNGTHIAFINGINVEPEDYSSFKTQSFTMFESLDPLKTDNHSISYNSYYNKSEGTLRDIAETYFEHLSSIGISEPESENNIGLLLSVLAPGPIQKFHQLCETSGVLCPFIYTLINRKQAESTIENLRTISTEMRKILVNENKKILFVSHSGGAMIVDRIRDDIKANNSSRYKLTSHLSLARPLKSNHERISNYSLDKDEVISMEWCT